MKKLLLTIYLILCAVNSHAACTGTYATTIPACALVSGDLIHIPGGATPYTITTSDREYILDDNLTVDGTGITINASNVVLNLNGKTITYNQVSAGEGVKIGGYNYHDIAITNGSIVQGVAMSEGELYGVGNNPILTSPYLVTRMQVADVSVTYGGRDIAGLVIKGGYPLIENNTVTDTYEYGTLKDRHSGVSAVYLSGEYAVVRGNTLVDIRHRGIEISHYAEVYNNVIGLRSMATNSSGVSGWSVHNVKVHHNTITGRGEHPIGIGFSGPPTTNIEIYNNTIDCQTTRMGTEYGQDPDSCTDESPCVTDRATGIRAHKEGHNVIVSDNNVIVRTDQHFQGNYSPTGQVIWLESKARGIQIGNPADGSALYQNNTVIAMDKDGSYGSDGTMPIGGIVCDTNYAGSNLVVVGNTVTSNLAPLVLGDGYGWCQGSPLFIQNTFIKSADYTATPNYPENFKTISSGLGGYYEGTGVLIDNVFQGGAADSDLDMHFEALTSESSNKNKSVTFGHLQADGYLYYEYRLHNNNGTTGSATPINETLNVVGPAYSVVGLDTDPPSTSHNGQSRSATAQSVALTASETATIAYCIGRATCTPSLTYSSAVTVRPGNYLCYAATDTADNVEATQCQYFGWPTGCR